VIIKYYILNVTTISKVYKTLCGVIVKRIILLYSQGGAMGRGSWIGTVVWSKTCNVRTARIGCATRLRTVTVRFPQTFSVPRCVGTTEKPLGTRYSVGVPRRCVSRPPRHRGRKRSNCLKRRRPRPSAVLPFGLWKPAGRREKWMMVTKNRELLFIFCSFVH